MDFQYFGEEKKPPEKLESPNCLQILCPSIWSAALKAFVKTKLQQLTSLTPHFIIPRSLLFMIDINLTFLSLPPNVGELVNLLQSTTDDSMQRATITVM